jgi:excisionase family DNA binding protein
MTPKATLLTTSEVAEMCQVTSNTVSRWVREGRIAAITLPGGKLRFRRSDVEEMLTPNQATGAA